MFSTPNSLSDPVISQPNLNPMVENYYAALALFEKAYGRGQRSRWLARLGLRRACLADLSRYLLKIKAVHASSAHSVPLHLIVGSLGRANDFDLHFNPLSRRTSERWLSIASAMYSGEIMPPVDLIQVGERYFVKDGHHRISAALACGQLDIDASVTVWEVEGPLPWEETACSAEANCRDDPATCADCQSASQPAA